MRISHKILQGLVAIVLASAALSAEATPSTGYFIYDEAGHLIGEYDANGNAVQEHIYLGDRPVAVVQGGSVNYVTTDQLNTPRAVTDASGTVEWSWTSDPFGNGQPTGSLTYNLRFPGQYFDAEMGHNYNYYRDYDPSTGRYIESDPIGMHGGINTYAYVYDDPYKYEDIFGLLSQQVTNCVCQFMMENNYNSNSAWYAADQSRLKSRNWNSPVLRPCENYLYAFAAISEWGDSPWFIAMASGLDYFYKRYIGVGTSPASLEAYFAQLQGAADAKNKRDWRKTCEKCKNK